MAFEAIRRVQPRARLVLVGDGPSRKELQARCPDAIFAGMRHGEDLAAHYASGDLFVFPSVTETFGNVTPEALASGLPVLAYDYAAASQLVQTGRHGALAPFGNMNDFVQLGARLAADPAALHEMGRQAREAACQASWERIISRIEGLYHALTEGRPLPQPESAPARPRLAV